MENTTLYVDLDGTCADFYEKANCLEKMLSPGYFERLKPIQSVCEAIRTLYKESRNGKYEVCILSSLPAANSTAALEKSRWIDRNICSGIKRYFCSPGESKADFVARRERRALAGRAFLLDDYSRNLIEWEAHGGTGIKLFNRYNGLGWNGYHFQGKGVSAEWKAAEIENEIKKILK